MHWTTKIEKSAIILPNFPTEALIALLGTVAGYLLSSNEQRSK